MNYSSFLFNCLLREHNVSFNELPYDRMYEEHNELREEFLKSEFNTDDKSEYDCINKFLNHKLALNINFNT